MDEKSAIEWINAELTEVEFEKVLPLVNLAKTFLSVSDKMDKDKLIKSVYASILAHDSALDSAEEIVDQCTLVATRLVTKRDAEIEALKEERNDAVDSLNHLRFMTGSYKVKLDKLKEKGDE